MFLSQKHLLLWRKHFVKNWRAVIFGTLKDDSLKINSFALNNNFNYRNVFLNGVNSLSKMIIKTKQSKTFLVKKHNILYDSDRTILCKLQQYVVQTLTKKCMERLYTSNVIISNSNIKSPIGKPIFAVNLPLKLFRATVSNADIRSLKSLYASLKKCLNHMLAKFEQNRMLQITRNFGLFDNKLGFL